MVLEVNVTGHLEYRDAKGGYGGGTMGSDFDFKVQTLGFPITDFMLPEWSSYYNFKWLWGKELDGLTGTYYENYWGCNQPHCQPAILQGTVGLDPYESSWIDISIARDYTADSFKFNIQISPNPIVSSATWSPSGCCVSGTIENFDIIGNGTYSDRCRADVTGK